MPVEKDQFDALYEHVTTIRVDVGKIEQHLSALNGKVLRHERELGRIEREAKQELRGIEKDITSNKISLAKIVAANGGTGLLSGGVVYLLLRLIGL